MCEGDTFCRCDLEEKDKERSIKTAIRFLREEGYNVERLQCNEQYRLYVKEAVAYFQCEEDRKHGGKHRHTFDDGARFEWDQ